MVDGSGRDAGGGKGSLLRADHQECDLASVTVQTAQTGLGWFLFCLILLSHSVEGQTWKD